MKNRIRIALLSVAIASQAAMVDHIAKQADALVGSRQASTSASIKNNDLVSTLTRQLGVTPEQAAGGVAALLKEASGKMPKGAFESLLKDVPGLSKLAGGGTLGTLAALASKNGFSVERAFESLGMKGDMVKRFVPAVIGYAKKFTSSQNIALLQKAWSAL